jgi:hypothetical protein
MSRNCVWCKAKLPTENAGSGHVITRGFCSDCRKYFSAPRDPMSLEQYLDKIGVPVLVMDDDVRVMGFNKLAGALLGCGLSCLGRYGGDLIECAYARLPGGCGNTEHCKACAIRKTITATYETGESRENVTAYQDIVTPGGTREVRYLISTEKAGNLVLMRIEEIPPNL